MYPRANSRSVPQIPAVRTRTILSPDAGRGSGQSRRTIKLGSSNNARMGPIQTKKSASALWERIHNLSTLFTVGISPMRVRSEQGVNEPQSDHAKQNCQPQPN